MSRAGHPYEVAVGVPHGEGMRLRVSHEGKVVKVGQVQTRVAEVEVGVPQEEGVPQGEGVGVPQGEGEEVGVPQEGAVGVFYGGC